jgi:hypothetical protein
MTKEAPDETAEIAAEYQALFKKVEDSGKISTYPGFIKH